MLDAHVQSMTLLATPFKAGTRQPVAFGPGSAWADITARIRAQIPVMLQHRLTPPPRETYSLNRCVRSRFVCESVKKGVCAEAACRKLSGAFLLAARLNAEVDCRKLWDEAVAGYRFSDGTASP